MATQTKKTTSSVSKKTVDKKEVAAEATKPIVEQKKSFDPKEIDSHRIVTVHNGFQGTLVYVSKRTGETFIWDSFGDVQDMEIGELRNARNSSKDFFINNWFMFDEDWVPGYLGVSQYYKDALPLDDFDSFFSKTPQELSNAIKKLSDGQKESLGFRARLLIEDGVIDSNKTIQVLEKELDMQLTNHDV